MTILFDLFHGVKKPSEDFTEWIPGWWYRSIGFPVQKGVSTDGDEWLLAGSILDAGNITALVRKFRKNGVEALFCADGQFLLAVCHELSDRVEIFRDRAGIMPIVYGKGREGFAMSVWPENVVRHAGITPAVSKTFLRHYPLYRTSRPPDTPLESVNFLPGRSSLTLSKDETSLSEHLMVRPAAAQYANLQAASADLGQMLSEAVRKRVTACNSVSSWLSGGNDSSLLVALARKHFSGLIKTIFVTFDDYQRNYGEDALAVARMCDTEHFEVSFCPKDYLNLWAKTIHTIQEPINSPCTIGQLGALDQLSLDSDLILTGEGADTVFGGPYWAPMLFLSKIAGVMPDKSRRLARTLSCRFKGSSFFCKAVNKSLQAIGTPLRDYMISELVFGDEDSVDGVFGAGTWSYALCDLGTNIGDNALEDLFSVLLLDWHPVWTGYLKRIGFKYGVMYCFPFLDYQLMQNSLRLPMRLRYHYASKKAVLKKYAAQFFDRKFIDKPKEGFGVPLGKWFARPEFAPFLKLPLEERSLRRGWWNEKALRESIEFHRAGYGSDASAESIPWITTNLELWARICLEGESPDLYKI